MKVFESEELWQSPILLEPPLEYRPPTSTGAVDGHLKIPVEAAQGLDDSHVLPRYAARRGKTGQAARSRPGVELRRDRLRSGPAQRSAIAREEVERVVKNLDRRVHPLVEHSCVLRSS
jgi:hypothetical protein